MLTYGPARPEEEQDLLDFANMVFSMNGEATDFARLQPRVYAKPGFAGITQVAREGGRVMGMVSAVSGELLAAGQPLRFGFIGTVSAHPYARGQGIMQRLMALTMDSLREQGCQVLVLGGQRQRYQHFGFEEAGSAITLILTPNSLRHVLGAPQGRFTFTPFAQAAQEARALARRLHAADDWVVKRSDADFETLLGTWDGKAFCVSEGGRQLGYFYVIGSRVSEFFLADPCLMPAVMADFLMEKGLKSLDIRLPGWKLRQHQGLFAAAHGFWQGSANNLRVLDWPAFLGTLLNYKAKTQGLAPGKRSLSVEGAGCFEIAVEPGNIAVRESGGKGDMHLDSLAATRLTALFLGRELYPGAPFQDWFPLPFFIPEADAF